ncbi:SCO1664 family protein [Nocardioides montaniterrae]
MLTLKGRIMPASNATFLATLDEDGTEVVYKPIAGERPLWDFPDGTLADREVAAYVVSEATGWGVVPRTWLGEGPHGLGMIQEWQVIGEDDAVTLLGEDDDASGWIKVVEGYDEHERPIVLVHEDTPALRRMVVLDAVINNADRKGGHVLAMADGRRLGVDHGVAFHHEPKLRTVLWGWAGLPLDESEVGVLTALRSALGGSLAATLEEHVAARELDALGRRIEDLLAAGRLPLPGTDWPSIPWPPF